MAINRKDFLANGAKTILISGGLTIFSACNRHDEKEVSPPEDLMQEHGLLNRVLLVYDHFLQQLSNKESLPLNTLAESAGIIRTFVENYHEKQEEDYIFPRFEKAGQLTELVTTLRKQHNTGRAITAKILSLSKGTSLGDSDNTSLTDALKNFIFMYRPHEAREDTVLFPAFRKLVSQHEYDSLGEEFEKNEHRLFGEDGFELYVDKISAIEKQLGIYELSQFTPRVG